MRSQFFLRFSLYGVRQTSSRGENDTTPLRLSHAQRPPRERLLLVLWRPLAFKLVQKTEHPLNLVDLQPSWLGLSRELQLLPYL